MPRRSARRYRPPSRCPARASHLARSTSPQGSAPTTARGSRAARACSTSSAPCCPMTSARGCTATARAWNAQTPRETRPGDSPASSTSPPSTGARSTSSPHPRCRSGEGRTEAAARRTSMAPRSFPIARTRPSSRPSRSRSWRGVPSRRSPTPRPWRRCRRPDWARVALVTVTPWPSWTRTSTLP